MGLFSRLTMTASADVKLFQRWNFDDIEVNDLSLQDYIGVKHKSAQYLPHSAGRWSKVRFRKAQCPIIERLTCSLMMHGRNNGKKLLAVRIVKQSIYLLATGAREASFRSIKTIAECLADEIINAAKGSSNSYAIKKKDEIERVAKANR